MRRCGPAKQCLWVGPGGYLSGGGRRFAYAHSNGNGNGYRDTDCNDHAACNSHRDTYHDSSAITFADADFNATAHSNSKKYSAIKASANSASAAMRIG
jgi:hypothetical protein